MELKQLAGDFPQSPGVYIMKGPGDEIIYIGKAKNIRKRVLSYFLKDRDKKTSILIQRVTGIESIITQNEYEALLLENNLIKRWKPRYNINLKDGKTYPVIRVTNGPFPRVFRTRRMVNDGSCYYGPYPDAKKIDLYLDVIDKTFKIRKCRGKLKKREFPCLYYHIGRCSAPCCGYVSQAEYARIIEKIKRMLEGNITGLMSVLHAEMSTAVDKLNFEKAAEVRDIISSIQAIVEKQEVVDFNPEKRDYITFISGEGRCVFVVFQMRGGKLIGRDLFYNEIMDEKKEALSDYLLQFVIQYYQDNRAELPREIFLREKSSINKTGIRLLRKFFRTEFKREIHVHIVEEEARGYAVLKLAEGNAVEFLQRKTKLAQHMRVLEEVREVLDLGKTPHVIEGFDIAQLAGKYPVAGMVSFMDGIPDKSKYRHFHIKTLKGKIDDYESIREVIARRYTRVLNEQSEMPDLILIDGGKGQVQAVYDILSGFNLRNLSVVGLAKQNEKLFIMDKKDPIVLPETSEALKLLQRIRDEAHRFATTFNQALRQKYGLELSILESISGIGPKRANNLISQFSSLEGIAQARIEEIGRVCRLGREQATRIHRELEQKIKTNQYRTGSSNTGY